jgi:hypothetical protein
MMASRSAIDTECERSEWNNIPHEVVASAAIDAMAQRLWRAPVLFAIAEAQEQIACLK